MKNKNVLFYDINTFIFCFFFHLLIHLFYLPATHLANFVLVGSLKKWEVVGSVIIDWRKDLPFQTGLLAPTPLIPVDLASYLQSCRAWVQCWGWRRSRTSCPTRRRSGKPLPRPDTRGTRSNCLGPFLGCDLRKDGQRSRQKNGQAEGKCKVRRNIWKLPTFRG